LLRKQAVKRYFIFLPRLTSAAALPEKTKSRRQLIVIAWNLLVYSPNKAERQTDWQTQIMYNRTTQ